MFLRAYIKKSISINFLERRLISTGIYIHFDETRNNLIVKKNFLKTICLVFFTEKMKKIDSKSKEIKIIIINISLKSILIHPYDPIAIVNITKEIKIEWKLSNILNKSVRGSGSFGSTGR
ncbi:dCTP deaminase/dUTPase family protein [Blattabacterium cuenoti]|uniref:hypothetical protein n=1 Tax=Blattabacterium cuenoti TaxID=1653831 RepID=UPI001EECBCF5|nr:hypothetical protein [Blattabacterium cuenoti]